MPVIAAWQRVPLALWTCIAAYHTSRRFCRITYRDWLRTTVNLWDCIDDLQPDGNEVRSPVTSYRYTHPLGGYVAALLPFDKVCVHDHRTRRRVYAWHLPRAQKVISMALCLNGTVLAVARDCRPHTTSPFGVQLEFYQSSTGTVLHTWYTYREVESMTISREGDVLLLCPWVHFLAVYDMEGTWKSIIKFKDLPFSLAVCHHYVWVTFADYVMAVRICDGRILAQWRAPALRDVHMALHDTVWLVCDVPPVSPPPIELEPHW